MIPDLCPAFAPARAPRTYRPVFLRRRIDDLSTAADFSLFLSLSCFRFLSPRKRESLVHSPPPPRLLLLLLLLLLLHLLVFFSPRFFASLRRRVTPLLCRVRAPRACVGLVCGMRKLTVKFDGRRGELEQRLFQPLRDRSSPRLLSDVYV